MPPAEPPRRTGGDESVPDRLPTRPARSVSRDELFRPDGPLTGRPEVTEDSRPTAERPPVPGEPPRPRRLRPAAGPAGGPSTAGNGTPHNGTHHNGSPHTGIPNNDTPRNGTPDRGTGQVGDLPRRPTERPVQLAAERTQVQLPANDPTQLYPAQPHSPQPYSPQPHSAQAYPAHPHPAQGHQAPAGPAGRPGSIPPAAPGPTGSYGTAAAQTRLYGAGPDLPAPGQGHPDGSGPAFGPGGRDDYAPQEPVGYPEPEPGRSRRGALVAGLAVVTVIALVALAIGVLLDRGENRQVASPPAPAPSAAAPGGEPGTGTGPGTTSAPTGAAASLEPIPDEPWDEDDLDFGFLTEVLEDGGDIILVINRASFYYGAEATRRNGGVAPDNDYLIEDSNPRLRRFVLEPGAPIRGSVRMNGAEAGPEGSPVERADFVRAAREAIAASVSADDDAENSGNTGLPVWLRHGGGEDGPVTAFAEQYQP